MQNVYIRKVKALKKPKFDRECDILVYIIAITVNVSQSSGPAPVEQFDARRRARVCDDGTMVYIQR